MTLDRQEYCSECGDPTGRAGNFHESVYVKFPGEERRGPLCDSCLDELQRTEGAEVIYE